MITTRALITCDGIWNGDPCRRIWVFRGGMSWHATIDAAIRNGWIIDRSGEWCPNHAGASRDLMGASLRRTARETATP